MVWSNFRINSSIQFNGSKKTFIIKEHDSVIGRHIVKAFDRCIYTDVFDNTIYSLD